jgi:pantoate--beta-alanine ligase
MVIARTGLELRKLISEQRSLGKRIGFVPTMGALHAGHLSLIKLAKERSDYTAASIFVNPAQFGPSEDYSRYPRTLEKDIDLSKQCGVDLVFCPSVEEIYGQGEMVTVDPGSVADTFEGKIRPGHFKGVLTVVAKLFNLVQPDLAVFGQKDAQQLFMIKRMTSDLRFPITIAVGETVREQDGLALSSRNVYLKAAERENAKALYRALSAGQRQYLSGNRSLQLVQEAMLQVTREVNDLLLDYATVVSEESFAETDPVADSSLLIIAGKLGSVRLIDNLPVRS